MARALIVFCLMLIGFAAHSNDDEPKPKSFVSVQGPCYEPPDLQKMLELGEFDLRSLGRSVNGRGIEAVVLFYVSGDKFLIVMRSETSACVIVAGDEIDMGV
jgi:hypothetical protein